MTALTAIEPYVASHEIEKSRAATLSSARLTSMTPELWGVILAGGEGIRLRPLTRVICGDERPKQYVRLTGSRSLLQQTLDRAALRIPAERTVVISIETQASYLAAAMPGHGASVLLQSANRGTAAGVLLPVHWIRRRAPGGATVAVFPSDHLVLEEEAFMNQVAQAAAFVDENPGRLRRLIDAIVAETAGNPFLSDFRPFQQQIAVAGMYNSLAQTLLKLVAPGVPDTYQGTEEWDLSLVDPDNRRPVDYARLREDLRAIRERLRGPEADRTELARSLLATKEDGRLKLYVTHQALEYRRQHPRLFAAGTYAPLEARGLRGEHAVAFGRAFERETVIVVVPRFLARLHLQGLPVGSVWAGTWLELPVWAPRVYRNVLTGERFEVATLEGRPGLTLEAAFATVPVALLAATDER